MAPLHHHFELKGYSEEKIVLLFMVLGYVFSFIAMVLISHSIGMIWLIHAEHRI